MPPPWWRRHWLGLAGLGVIRGGNAVLGATVLPAWIVSIGPGAKVDHNTRFNARSTHAVLCWKRVDDDGRTGWKQPVSDTVQVT